MTLTTQQRQLPVDREAEDAVVAAMLVDNETIPAIANMAEAKHFYQERNGWLFDAAIAVWARGETVNQITVAHEMAGRGQLSEAGGQTWMSDIIRMLPTTIGVEWYANIVRRDALYRDLIRASHTIQQLAYDAPADQQQVLTRAESLILGIGKKRIRPKARPAGDVLMGADGTGKGALLQDIQDFLDDPTRMFGLETGWPWLDRLTGGYAPSQVITVMADTSVGKSLFGHWTAREQALRGVPVLIISTEMSAEEVINRLVYMQAGVDRMAIRMRGRASDEQKRKVNNAALTVSEWPIHIVDVGGITLDGVRTEIRRHVRSAGIELAIVDHIQQVVVPGQALESPAAISATINGIKDMAMDEYIPIIAVSHINRDATKGKLGMHSGKGGGSIEQASNRMLLIEPVRWSFDTWALMDDDELAEQVKHDKLDVRINVPKGRDGGGRAWNIRHISWAQGGRFVDSPRAGTFHHAN